MIDDAPETTETAYGPDGALRELLEEVLETAHIEYGDQRPFSLPIGDSEVEGLSIDYELMFEDPEVGMFTLDGTETYSPIGVFMSLSGHLGLAASVALAQALAHGEPTQAYLDEAPPPEWPPNADPYQDLTAEWYRPWAVEAGVDDARLANRGAGFEHELIPVSQLEHYATVWLSAGQS
jgi:hypothetical protein